MALYSTHSGMRYGSKSRFFFGWSHPKAPNPSTSRPFQALPSPSIHEASLLRTGRRFCPCPFDRTTMPTRSYSWHCSRKFWEMARISISGHFGGNSNWVPIGMDAKKWGICGLGLGGLTPSQYQELSKTTHIPGVQHCGYYDAPIPTLKPKVTAVGNNQVC